MLTPKHKWLIIIGLIAALGLVYFAMLSLSWRGWGYAGYRGFYYGPSFWYWGGPTYYRSPSNRTGSVGGPRHVGGGPGYGK